MGEGNLSGIDIVQRYFPPASGTQIIYMSGYLSQATEVYRTDHVYFLLKPIDPHKLRDALGKAYASLAVASPCMLHIVSDHRDRLVNPNTIRYLESNLHKVSVHCGPVVYDIYAKLDDIQEQLSCDFSRCHRSYLVNLAFVSRLDEHELYLHDGTTLPVSRRRAREVQRDLLMFLSKG
jgi:DNA-binding LytR/AlgR family response regulator